MLFCLVCVDRLGSACGCHTGGGSEGLWQPAESREVDGGEGAGEGY